MKKIYDGFLFDECGGSIPLSSDEFIDYLLETIQHLSSEKRFLEKQLSDIETILHPPFPADLN
jgi:hypothetical protein